MEIAVARHLVVAHPSALAFSDRFVVLGCAMESLTSDCREAIFDGRELGASQERLYRQPSRIGPARFGGWFG
jgi:hypothetical protein